MKKLCMFLTFMLSILIFSSVKAYDVYEVGDNVSYMGNDYFVVRNSSSDSSYVTLVKSTPLSSSEIEGTGVSINAYSSNHDNDEENSVALYTSDTCGVVSETLHNDSCENSFDASDVKKILDKWIESFASDLVIDEANNEAYKVRLLSIDDIYELDSSFEANDYINQEQLLISDYSSFWIMNMHYQSRDVSNILYIDTDTNVKLANRYVYEKALVVPVINLKKSALNPDSDATADIDGAAKVPETTKDSSVNVANTLLKQSIITLVIGGIIIAVGVALYVVNKKRK